MGRIPEWLEVAESCRSAFERSRAKSGRRPHLDKSDTSKQALSAVALVPEQLSLGAGLRRGAARDTLDLPQDRPELQPGVRRW